MGFWSSIGNAFSSVCSAVGGAISSAFGSVSSALGSALSGIGSVIGAVSTAFAPMLSALSVAMPYIGAVINVIDAVCRILGLQDKDESIPDIGDRVLQGQEAGVTPTSFETYEKYMEAIRSFELDPKKSKDYNLGEKVAAGVGAQFWGMEEKFGVGSGILLTHIIKDAPNLAEGKGFFTEERISRILDGVDTVADVVKYFDKKLEPNEQARVEQKMVDIEKSLSPQKSLDDIYQELDAQRNGS